MTEIPAGLIDVHTHGIDAALPDLNGHFPGSWPAIAHRGDGRANVAIGTTPYRVVDERCWSVDRRLADMDADGVAMQVISPMPATLLHGADPAGAAVLATAQNDFLAALHAAAPGRLQGFGAVPLQDLDAAVHELRRCVTDLGLLGVAIGTRVGALDLAAEELDPFFRAAADLGAIVFIHPVDAETDPRLQRLGLGFGAGMPTETGIAGAGLLERRVMARRPGLTLLLAHGAGTLPWLLPRLDRGERLQDPHATYVASVRVRALYADSLTYDADQLGIVAGRIGGGHVLLGTDYPFIARERPAGAVLHNSPGLTEELVGAIGRDNAFSLIVNSEKGTPWATSSASA